MKEEELAQRIMDANQTKSNNNNRTIGGIKKEELKERDRLRREKQELRREIVSLSDEVGDLWTRKKTIDRLEEENKQLREDPKVFLDKELVMESTRLKNELRDLKAREETTIRKWTEETLRELEGVVNRQVGDLRLWLRTGHTEWVHREREVIVVKKREGK